MAEAGDYVLGTDQTELARLGRQHLAWRETMLGAWRAAGIRPGSRVVDVGAGPGWATWDIAELVGPTGSVLAVERAERFTAALADGVGRRRLSQVEILAADLMTSTPPAQFDFAWCRWVASFTPSVDSLVNWIRRALRPGGRAVFHEYLSYGTWRFLPVRPVLQEFVEEVMASWRASSGEPDVAPVLMAALQAGGFTILSCRPLTFSTRPGELMWQWPAGFVATNVARLIELERVSRSWGDQVLSQLAAAEADSSSLMITPMVLELVVERSA